MLIYWNWYDFSINADFGYVSSVVASGFDWNCYEIFFDWFLIFCLIFFVFWVGNFDFFGPWLFSRVPYLFRFFGFFDLFWFCQFEKLFFFLLFVFGFCFFDLLSLHFQVFAPRIIPHNLLSFIKRLPDKLLNRVFFVLFIKLLNAFFHFFLFSLLKSLFWPRGLFRFLFCPFQVFWIFFGF